MSDNDSFDSKVPDSLLGKIAHAPALSPARERIGEQIGRYRLDEVLGQGGFGKVFGAFDTMLQRRVALKVLRADAVTPEGRARLLREARIAAALEHINIVRIYDVGEDDGIPFIAMERLEGATLREYIGDSNVATSEKIGWLVAIASALAAAHERGLIHRDVKPDNVHVGRDGVVRVLDFGIARATVSPADASQMAVGTVTEKGIVVGTPAYMSPEQLRGDPIDGRSDQFAWGVVACELLTGRIPWSGDGLALVSNILSGSPQGLDDSGMPHEIASIVARALSKSPDDRFPTLEKASGALLATEAASELRSSAAKARPSTPEPRRSDREVPRDRPLSTTERSRIALEATVQAPPDMGGVEAPSKPASVSREKSELAASVAVTPLRSETTLEPTRRWSNGAKALMFVVAIAAAALVGSALATRQHAVAPADFASAAGDAHAHDPIDDPAPHAPVGANAEDLALYREAWNDFRNGAEDVASVKFDALSARSPRFAAAALRAAFIDHLRGSETDRAQFNRALAGRDSLDEHDLAFLDALTPEIVQLPPSPEAAIAAMRSAAARFGDIELRSVLARLLLMNGEVDESLSIAIEGLRAAPRFAPNYFVAAEAQLYVGRWDEDARLLDQCERELPLATTCIRERGYLHLQRGECNTLAADSAKFAIVADPKDATSARWRIRTLVESGATAPAVTQALSAVRPQLGAGATTIEARALCVIHARDGDFEAANEECARFSTLIAGTSERLAHGRLTRLKLRIAQESGHPEIARREARMYLDRLEGFAPLSRHDDGAATNDPTMEAAAVLHEAGEIDDAALTAFRDRFLSEYGLKNIYRTTAWLLAWAVPVRNQREAEAALAALPSFGGSLSAAGSDAFPYAFAGRVYLLANKLDEAIIHLRHAARSCDVYADPIGVIRAELWLGQALEAKGRTAEACNSYATVVAKWGRAKPRSVSAEEARDRSRKLRCDKLD